jgi:hypothetical protein
MESDKITATWVSEQILRHLRDHPQAGDTIEGIAMWWLPRSITTHHREPVRQAMDDLVARNKIIPSFLVDGTAFNSAAARPQKTPP